MIPYPGESLPLTDFANLTYVTDPDGPIFDYDRITYRAGTTNFVAGESAEVRTDIDPFYRDDEDTEPLEFAWVVEVAGGAGTLALTDGLDTAGTSLGSHAVTGGDTLVVPTDSVTLADLYAVNGDAVLIISCTSGDIDVQQIKLRAWPPGGARGGLGGETYPAWDVPGVRPALYSFSRPALAETGWYSEGTSLEELWATAQALMQAESDMPADIDLGTVSTEFSGQMSVQLGANFNTEFEEGSALAVVGFNAGVVARRSPAQPGINPALGLVEEVDYITPPTEVAGDGDAVPVSGEAYNEWANVGVAYTHDIDAGQGDLLKVAAREFDRLPQFYSGGWYTPPSGDRGHVVNVVDLLADSPGSLSMPDADIVLVNGSHHWLVGDAVMPTPPGPNPQIVGLLDSYTWQLGDGSFDPEGNALPLSYTIHRPAYRLWTLNPPAIHKVRQFHRDDGLGVTPPRAFGGASRIRTGRAYGYD